jgi:hypothetical protein
VLNRLARKRSEARLRSQYAGDTKFEVAMSMGCRDWEGITRLDDGEVLSVKLIDVAW